MKELTCIVCPNGCRLTVDEENGFRVTGNKCEKGAEYGKTECQRPVRVVTSTVRITGAAGCRLPVKTSAAIDKDKMFSVMQLLSAVTVAAPVRLGDVIVPDILGTGVSIVACKTMNRL